MEDKKNLVWWVVAVIVILIAVAFLVYYMRSGTPSVPPTVSQPQADSASAIEADLKALDLSDLGSELSDIDKELAQ